MSKLRKFVDANNLTVIEQLVPILSLYDLYMPSTNHIPRVAATRHCHAPGVIDSLLTNHHHRPTPFQ
jgi:hypothetical protein